MGEDIVFTAARHGDRVRLRTLLVDRCLDFTNKDGETPLHAAAGSGNWGGVKDIISMVVASGVFTEYVNMRASNGQSAVFMAAAKGHTRIVKLLADAGADINLKDALGLTPLLAAISNTNGVTAKALIRMGAETHVTTACRNSCLHIAAAKGLSELVSILLHSCSLDSRDNQNKTAIYLAAEKGHHRLVEMLATAGANVDIQAYDCTTPLMAATVAQSEQCVEVLLKHNADPNVVCCSLWPQLAIHAAVRLENTNILKQLVAVTAQEVGSAAEHVSPVYEALEHPEMLEVLLSAGYSPEGQPCRDVYEADSPLSLMLSSMMEGSISDDCESLPILLRAGARLTEECWQMCLQDLGVLELVLELRCKDQRKGPSAGRLLAVVELEALQSVAAEQAAEASSWLPTLVERGLDPNALLLPDFLKEADGDTLTYLLEMVNWSTLALPLRNILIQRQKQKTWTPPAHLESVPSLFHLCRLCLRTHLGPDELMRTEVACQLPVPTLLRHLLRFEDITSPNS